VAKIFCEAFPGVEVATSLEKMVSEVDAIWLGDASGLGEDHYWLGHHYQMLNMADAFRKMVETGVEPVPHQEILEVTAIIHAGVKSRDGRSRLVTLAEVME
jgi:hypothetical protein